MKPIKSILAALLLFSTTVFAASPVDKDNPFLTIASDDHVIIKIGAYGSLVPKTTPKGDVVLSIMVIQQTPEKDHPKGEEVQYVILANCKNQVAKVVPIWAKADEASQGKPRFEEKDLAKQVLAEMNKTPEEMVEQNTLLGLSVDAACMYVGEGKDLPKQPHKKVKKVPDLEV